MRLIDADELAKELMHEALGYQYHRVANAPTVDAVPVIRCKDCKWWMHNPYRESSVFGLCFKHEDIAIATDNTDWCSWAERKEE